LKQQLKAENFAAAAQANYPVTMRMQPLYDHSYYFISTFMRDHIDFHSSASGFEALSFCNHCSFAIGML
jgi:S-formylglutathione hydrolase